VHKILFLALHKRLFAGNVTAFMISAVCSWSLHKTDNTLII